MVTIVSGLVGGLVATIGMTVLMMVLGDDSPPPTALFVSKYFGDGDPEDYMMPGMALHMLYGIVAAAVFVVALPVVGLGVESLTTALVWGLVYGFVLFLGAAVFWMNIVLGMDPEPKMAGMFLVFHLVYGGILGAWLGLGIL